MTEHLLNHLLLLIFMHFCIDATTWFCHDCWTQFRVIFEIVLCILAQLKRYGLIYWSVSLRATFHEFFSWRKIYWFVITAYFTKMRTLTDELNALVPIPKCTCVQNSCTCGVSAKLSLMLMRLVLMWQVKLEG